MLQVPTEFFYGSDESSHLSTPSHERFSLEAPSASEKSLETRGRPRAALRSLIPSFDGALDQYKRESSQSPDASMRTTRSSIREQEEPQTSDFKRKREPNSADGESSHVKKSRRTSTRYVTSTSTTIKQQQHQPSESPVKRTKGNAGSLISTLKKVKRTSSGYAPPSKYAHVINKLTDSLAPNLICVFIGVNPGIRTATTGHAYNHPSNLFWKLLHKSGCTPRLCRAEEDGDMPRLFDLGLTNIVRRPTKDAGELSKAEMDAGVAELEAKIALDRPEAVAIVGKGIWESLWRVRHGSNIKKEQFKYGWQDDSERMGVVRTDEDQWPGARVFVTTTTSGLAAGMRPHEKEEVWRGLGEWVKDRRQQRIEAKEDLTDQASGSTHP
ncbi:MAG: hypothetical protein Q9208_006986 [Pyrenodesmia sp. 3 TL-2023]